MASSIGPEGCLVLRRVPDRAGHPVQEGHPGSDRWPWVVRSAIGARSLPGRARLAGTGAWHPDPPQGERHRRPFDLVLILPVLVQGLPSAWQTAITRYLPSAAGQAIMGAPSSRLLTAGRPICSRTVGSTTPAQSTPGHPVRLYSATPRDCCDGGPEDVDRFLRLLDLGQARQDIYRLREPCTGSSSHIRMLTELARLARQARQGSDCHVGDGQVRV